MIRMANMIIINRKANTIKITIKMQDTIRDMTKTITTNNTTRTIMTKIKDMISNTKVMPMHMIKITAMMICRRSKSM